MTSTEYFTSQVAAFISENGHKFYDAILVTSDKHEYKVNKVVLAVRSDYFKALFKKDGTNTSFRDKPLDRHDLPYICQNDLKRFQNLCSPKSFLSHGHFHFFKSVLACLVIERQAICQIFLRGVF